MGYRTVLVHVDLSRHAPARIGVAAAICAEHGACLIGAAMTGIARAVFPNGMDIKPDTLLAGYIDPLARNARRALDRFEEIARAHGIAHETRVVCDQVPDGLALLARFADLVVLSQDDPDESLGYLPPAAPMPDYVVCNAARPVLIVPRAWSPPSPGTAWPRAVLLCWNGSKEAALALAGALPLLRRASQVLLAVIGPAPPPASAGAQELADAQAYLRRHGVTAELALRAPRGNTGRAILALATERGCDLVVMGCYGQTRFQALLLGGASATVLREAGLPVLMAR